MEIPALTRTGIQEGLVYSVLYIEAMLNSETISPIVRLIFSYCFGPAFEAPEAYCRIREGLIPDFSPTLLMLR